MRELAVYIYRNEGLKDGFFKGISINLVKVPIGLGFGFFIKAYINNKLDQVF